MQILNEIPVEFDLEAILKHLHVGTEDAEEVRQLIEQAKEVARPKALYRMAVVEGRDCDTVTIDGVRFTSSDLSSNLDKAEGVFPYIATCGTELDGIDVSDPLELYWLDTIKAIALGASSSYLLRHVKERYTPGKLSSVNPGSIDGYVWPIEQQRELFSLLGDVEKMIGVKLTDSFLMIPNKTVSGLYFKG